MLKRFGVLVMTLVYLSVSTGFTVSAHYCMGLIASVSFSQHPNCSPMPDGSCHSCCKTTTFKVLLKDNSFKAVPRASQETLSRLDKFTPFVRPPSALATLIRFGDQMHAVSNPPPLYLMIKCLKV